MPPKDNVRNVAANIGWGHTLPMDDFLQGDMISGYEVFDPDMRAVKFKVDKNANEGLEDKIYTQKPDASFPSATIFQGDSFAKKLYFDAGAKSGVYQFAASTYGVQFAIWDDEKGRQKWGRKYLDELKNAKNIKLCWNFKSYAKAFVTKGEWSQPLAIGHELEFIPLGDLSKLKVGDEVEFKVLFRGEPLHSVSEKGGLPDTISAFNEYLGDAFIGAYVIRGNVKFKLVKPGRWLLTLGVVRPVDKDTAPELIGKAINVGYQATATFFVRE